MRRAANVDKNQSAIVDLFRKLQHKVFITSAVGAGFPDTIVLDRFNNIPRLVEVKNPKQPPSKRKLRDTQKDFHEEWPCEVVMTHEDVVELNKKWEMEYNERNYYERYFQQKNDPTLRDRDPGAVRDVHDR